MSLTRLGSFNAGQLNLSIQAALPGLQAQLGALTGQLANLQASLSVVAQVQLPDPLSLMAGLQAAISNVPNLATQLPQASLSVTQSLTADIASIGAQISVLQSSISALQGAFNAGGIEAWSYSGEAQRFGPELTNATNNGIAGSQPEQNVNGLVLACADPTAWATFGSTFLTG